MRLFSIISLCMLNFYSLPVSADYALGCQDPEYESYIQQRFSYYEQRNRRLFSNTLRDYELSLATSKNPYRVIGDLSRHLKYSAQFEPIDSVMTKIDRIFEHADELSVQQQIAGDVVDSFSSETHAVGIARAWLAYRQGAPDVAFRELINSIERSGSAVLSSFGPDFEFIRHIYRDGHVNPVITYISKTQDFWIGKRAEDLRDVWLKMIAAGCKIQFDSDDTLQAQKLGIDGTSIDRD